jgi:hypothetical protein
MFNFFLLVQSIEDFILLIGTSVAFVAFVLWCCFPIEPKDSLGSEHLSTQVIFLQGRLVAKYGKGWLGREMGC